MAGGAGSPAVIGGGKAQDLQAFSFCLRPAKSGEGPIFLRMDGFSPNLWTAQIQYGFENALISALCQGFKGDAVSDRYWIAKNVQFGMPPH
jgi:hypothetical protein